MIIETEITNLNFNNIHAQQLKINMQSGKLTCNEQLGAECNEEEPIY